MDTGSFPYPDRGPAFCTCPLDRAEDRRGDDTWLAGALRRGRFLVVRNNRVRMVAGTPPRIAWHEAVALDSAIERGAPWVFLGVDGEGRPHFAVDGDGLSMAAEHVDLDVRSIAMQWAAAAAEDDETGVIAQALALLDWHRRHRFCAHCGALTTPRRAGYQRHCARCGAEHFPRTDPVVIMLVGDGARCLLGRQAHFPPGMYSALAGFVEPGETAEAAVRREVHEEAGIEVRDIRYAGSQPWPFPANLMLGFLATPRSFALRLDRNELEDARWVRRDEVAAALAGRSTRFFVPPPIAIAHNLIKSWLDASACQ
ncbi:MAG: NAD(+) diphosphatase [Alphaproteobacteria bacterium]|nr:MAG: NAD(+) diphosphatase [Alphaproteobacteria bacterium]